MLRGAVVLSVEAFVDGSGAALGYHAAVSVKREIYIAPGFKTAYAKVAQLIVDIGGRWIHHDDEEQYLTAKAECFKKKRRAQCIALVATAEMGTIAGRVKAKIGAAANALQPEACAAR